MKLQLNSLATIAASSTLASWMVIFQAIFICHSYVISFGLRLNKPHTSMLNGDSVIYICISVLHSSVYDLTCNTNNMHTMQWTDRNFETFPLLYFNPVHEVEKGGCLFTSLMPRPHAPARGECLVTFCQSHCRKHQLYLHSEKPNGIKLVFCYMHSSDYMCW